LINVDIVGAITGLFGSATKAVDEIFTNKEEKILAKAKLTEIRNALNIKLLDFNTTLVKAQSAIIQAEAQSASWLTRSWRPIMMMMFGFIIFNNYILHPYLSLIWKLAPLLPVPPELWTIITVGMSGYIVTRGLEKTAKEYKKK